MGIGLRGWLLASVLCISGYSFTLNDVQREAEKRHLPTELFEDMKAYGRSVSFRGQDIKLGRYYRFFNCIALNQDMFQRGPSQWLNLDWSLFYNELFHAWWDQVFEEAPEYRPLYRRMKSRYAWKYKEANPSDPTYAMEEAYSETAAAVILLIVNKIPEEKHRYRKRYSVESADHYEDQPSKFSSNATSVYPNKSEYRHVYRWLTGKNPPRVPQTKT